MAENDGKLEIGFSVDNSTLERGFKRSQQVADQSLGNIEKRADRAKSRIEKSMAEASSKASKSLADIGSGDTFAAAAARLSGVVAAAFGGRAIVNNLNQWQSLNNALKVAGLSGADLTNTLDRLFAAAQRQNVPLESLVTLFGRATQSAKELGATRDELIQFSEDIATALRVAGTSPEQASGALLQLSQLLGSSRVQAEEFNSVNEGARPILQAVARGIEEAAGSVSKLKALVTDGKISNVAFFRGFQAGVGELREQAASAEPTITQATTKIQNAILKMTGEVDRSSGFSKELVAELDSMADGFLKATDPIKEVVALLQKLADLQKYISDNGLNLGKKLNQAIFGTDTVTEYLFPPAPKLAGSGGIGSDPDRNYRPQEKAKPIKAADFPVTGAKDGKESIDQYERATRALNEQTRVLQIEASAVGRSTFEKQKALDVERLLNAAREAGKTITPQLRAEIEAEADAHARAAQELQNAEHRMEANRELQQEVGSQLTDSIHGLVTGAKSLNDVLADTLDTLIKLALQAAILGTGPLAGMFGTSGGSGIVGAVFGGARAGGGDVERGKSYLVGEKGPELFTPGKTGGIVPHDVLRSIRPPTVNVQAAQPAAQAITFAPVVNVTGGGGSLSENRDLSQQMVSQLRSLFREEMFEFVRVQQGPRGILER